MDLFANVALSCNGINGQVHTRVVEKCLGFTSIFWWCDELPDETLDVFISTVVKQTKYQDDTADRLHITLAQTPLTPGMGEDIPPATPTVRKKGGDESDQSDPCGFHPSNFCILSGTRSWLQKP